MINGVFKEMALTFAEVVEIIQAALVGDWWTLAAQARLRPRKQ
jgi:hypothetical protein